MADFVTMLPTFPYQGTWAWPHYSPGSQHTLDRQDMLLCTKTTLTLKLEAKFWKQIHFSLQSPHSKWVFMSSSVALLGTKHTNKVFLACRQKEKTAHWSGTRTGERCGHILQQNAQYLHTVRDSLSLCASLWFVTYDVSTEQPSGPGTKRQTLYAATTGCF